MTIDLDGERIINNSIENLRRMYHENKKLMEEMAFEAFVERMERVKDALIKIDYLFRKHPNLKEKYVEANRE